MEIFKIGVGGVSQNQRTRIPVHYENPCFFSQPRFLIFWVFSGVALRVFLRNPSLLLWNGHSTCRRDGHRRTSARVCVSVRLPCHARRHVCERARAWRRAAAEQHAGHHNGHRRVRGKHLVLLQPVPAHHAVPERLVQRTGNDNALAATACLLHRVRRFYQDMADACPWSETTATQQEAASRYG